ncbi:MAG: hypothetical protein GF346_03250, partial [Candidatus Eisenbacteria bacterium]|nr:hypothetical protein [Candidatus Latescibacterota bacterium]MBD3301438.1 hypothetical protein [Candidatus Eisenbacteria bacterium]
MRLGWVGRQIAAFLSMAALLIVVSGFLQLIGAVRQATRQAEVEADLVAASVGRELSRIVQDRGLSSVDRIGPDPGLDGVLLDAMALAPSVFAVAVLDPGGRVV